MEGNSGWLQVLTPDEDQGWIMEILLVIIEPTAGD